MSISASGSANFSFLGSPQHPVVSPRKASRISPLKLSKNQNFDEKSETQNPFFPLRVSKTLLLQSAVALFGLGFIDAGYSGDWSRIGVISRETEELLKTGAYLQTELKTNSRIELSSAPCYVLTSRIYKDSAFS
ncbi:hypothetical protein H6P81_019910 [Aristolochia fimbriata]|uniref:DUF7887 domain-containing protein n=1 Tax=Aristolochia fimbriata TaxID=158543 RepID=A0AAV7DSX8_ARIFI|nr:hypothetical protein H6P81_019910 [Aristolochia fimbriata]